MYKHSGEGESSVNFEVYDEKLNTREKIPYYKPDNKQEDKTK